MDLPGNPDVQTSVKPVSSVHLSYLVLEIFKTLPHTFCIFPFLALVLMVYLTDDFLIYDDDDFHLSPVILESRDGGVA